MDEFRRAGTIRFTPEVFLCLCKGKFEVSENKIPATARIVECKYNGAVGAFEIVLEDDSFEKIHRGATPPMLSAPVIKKIEE